MIIPVFDELKHLIVLSRLSIRALSKQSGVCENTLDDWLNGQTQMPRIDTMLRVANVLGRHIELTPTIKRMVKFYPPPKPRVTLMQDWMSQ